MLVTQSGFTPSRALNEPPNWVGPLVDLGSFTDSVYEHNTRLKIEIGFEIPAAAGQSPWQRVKRKRIDQSPINLKFTICARKDDPNGRLSTINITDVKTGGNLVLRYTDKETSLEMLGQKRTWVHKELRSYSEFNEWIVKKTRDISNHVRSDSPSIKSRWQRLERLIANLSLWWFLGETQRVSSGRNAPKRWYPFSDLQSFPTRLHFSPVLFDAVNPAMISESGRDDHLYPFRRKKLKVQKTLSSILKELDIASSIKDSRLSAYHAGIDIKDSVTGVVSKLIDVGYGASQVIPVIHGCLSAATGPLFIEQPEIHLHPRAQGTIAELICQASNHRQVIVETHSVHMINRARILVARGDISHKDVIINFVERTSKGAKVHPLNILPNGDFDSEWPEGFFDERYQDTMFLLGLKSAHEE